MISAVVPHVTSPCENGAIRRVRLIQLRTCSTMSKPCCYDMIQVEMYGLNCFEVWSLGIIVIHGHWKSRLQKKMEANQSPDLKGNPCQISAQYKSIWYVHSCLNMPIKVQKSAISDHRYIDINAIEKKHEKNPRWWLSWWQLMTYCPGPRPICRMMYTVRQLPEHQITPPIIASAQKLWKMTSAVDICSNQPPKWPWKIHTHVSHIDISSYRHMHLLHKLGKRHSMPIVSLKPPLLFCWYPKSWQQWVLLCQQATIG